MKGYGEYKNADIPWLATLPNHWSTQRAKSMYAKASRAVVATDEVVTCFRDGIVTLRKNRRTTGFTESLKEIGYQGIRKGDLVIHVMDAFAGAVGVSDSDGKGTPVYNVCVPKGDYNNFYYAYIVREMAKNGFIQSLYRGIRERSSDFRYEVFAAQELPVPPREEQDQIVRYLDTKVGKINKLIRIKQQQIALLKEKKQAIINQAVTKGLDPNAPMKDSGIAWIGQIPDGWTVERLKFLMGKIVDCPHETPHYSAEGTYFVIRTADQDYGFLRDTDKMYRLDSQEYQQRIRRERLLKDDIVYGREGERWGLACLVPESDMFCLGQRMMQFRCNSSKIIPQFAVWMLNAQYIYRQGTLDTLGSTSPHVNIATIKNYYCILPSIEVQESISKFVNEVSCGAENLIKNMESKIAALTEYRTRLISDVVTGKADVRNIRIDDSPLSVLEEEYDEEEDDATDVLECEA